MENKIPTRSREEIEEIKNDIRETIKFTQEVNMDTESFIKQKIRFLPDDLKQLYQEIYQYIGEGNE